MVKLLLLAAVLAQSGCAAVVYSESRKVTRAAVVAHVPAGMPVDAAADCAMKSLGAMQVMSLPNSGTLDGGPKEAALVAEVFARPDVVACIAAVRK